MPAAAPRAPAPAAAPAQPAQGSKSAPIAAATRIRVPRSAPQVPAGPAIKLTNPVAAKDPRFKQAIEKLEKSASRTKTHPSAVQKAAEAQAAVQPPANEKLAGAQVQQVDTMKDAPTGKPEPDSFLALLRAEIEKVMPKTLGDTDTFMKGDKKQELKGAVTGNVNQQKQDATSGIKSATSQPPDASKVEGKEVTPLPAEGPAAPPPAVGAASAMPAPKAATEVSLQQSKQDANQSLAEARVTPEQLRKANDPRFSAVLTAKTAVEKQADSAPQRYRADEQKTLALAAAKAGADEQKGLAAMQGVRGKSNSSVSARQQAAKAKDEADLKDFTTAIEAIYNRTKQTVETKLASLETEVSSMFDQGVEAAMKSMTEHVDARMSAWKRERYLLNPLAWVADKLLGLPDDVKPFYEEGRKLFTQALDQVIVRIAALVDARLKEAKDEIAKGQQEISDRVAKLPGHLQAAGRTAEKEMSSRFDELRQSVDDKRNDLAQNLAQRYKEASDKADEKLKEMQAENKGLITALREKLGEVVKVLREFKERVMGMLKKGEDTINLIVADPIGFLKNLLNAIKQGIKQFADNIWTHLKTGFMKWLFGSLADAGITLPTDFSLGSILKLVLQVLGLTYDRIRAKAVKLIGERNVMLLEKAWELIHALITGGPAALWEKIKEFLGNLKEMVIDAIQEWVVASVIKAAITKLATMFNPVGAIIQAILAIYNTVMFFIERINQILDFVEAIINSVYKIATGDIGSAANWVEQALARTIPIIIGFLARLLGLTGITEKIVGIIKKIQNTVDKAIDKLIQKIIGGIGKLFGKGKGKEAEEPKSPAEEKWRIATEAIHNDLVQVEQEGISDKELNGRIQQWREKYGFQTLAVETKDDGWVIVGSMSPAKVVDTVPRPGSKKLPFKLSWPKPPSAEYPTLYFGGRRNKIQTQATLKDLKGKKDDTGTEVQEYHPNERKKLPGGPTIGLTEKYRIGTGTIVGPLSDASTPGGQTLNQILREYGFSPTREGKDADHVREIQLGGDDVVENLWPLDASINRGAGSTLKSASVEYPNSGKTITIAELKQNKSRQYYFRITKFSY